MSDNTGQKNSEYEHFSRRHTHFRLILVTLFKSIDLQISEMAEAALQKRSIADVLKNRSS